MNRKVTIQDIADELGVSRNTVSKAINNSEGLAEATRERILQKAIEMGYKQFSYMNAVVSAAAEESRTPGFAGEIAVLTTMFLGQSHFASSMLDRFQRELAQAGYTLNTHLVMPENIAALTLPMTFIKERVSGLVCFELFDRPYAEMVCALGIPVLFVDGPNKSRGESLPCDQLYMENTTEITRLVCSMLARGKRRIGFIGNWEHCQSFYERYMAFRTAMLFSGAETEARFLIQTNDPAEMEGSLNALTELPDLFVCANDFVALDAMGILRRRGVRVPEDVMFCGFDDSPESRRLSPALTTVHIHTQIMGRVGARLLLSRIREPDLDYRYLYTETYLIERESTKGQL